MQRTIWFSIVMFFGLAGCQHFHLVTIYLHDKDPAPIVDVATSQPASRQPTLTIEVPNG